MSKHTEAFRKQKKYASFLKFLDSLTEEEWEELEKEDERRGPTEITGCVEQHDSSYRNDQS